MAKVPLPNGNVEEMKRRGGVPAEKGHVRDFSGFG